MLDAPGRAVARAVHAALPAGRVKEGLSGTWLGRALHPQPAFEVRDRNGVLELRRQGPL